MLAVVAVVGFVVGFGFLFGFEGGFVSMFVRGLVVEVVEWELEGREEEAKLGVEGAVE